MGPVCTAPQPDDGMVQGLLNSVDCNVRTLSEAGYGALAQPYSPMAGFLTGLLTLYIAFTGYRMMVGRMPLRIGDVTISAVKIGVVLMLATQWPTYQQLVFETLFKGPEQIASSLLSVAQPGGSGLGRNPFDALQAAYDQLQVAAQYFNQRSVGLSSPLTGGSAGAALALNASAMLMLLTGLGSVLSAKIVLGLLLGLGPLFVALLLFDATRGIFEGWLRAALAFALVPLMATLALVVELGLIEPQLVLLADLQAQGLSDTAPANAILLLTLISTGVCTALAVAVGVIAFSLRLPNWGGASIEGRGDRAAPVANVVSTTAAGPAQVLNQPRAAQLAAAAAAMERREGRVPLLVAESSGPSRPNTGRPDPGASTARQYGLGQSQRRAVLPRQAASNQRRDR